MRLHWVRPESRFGLLQIYGFLGLAGLLVARFIPVAVIFRGYWGCPFRQATGIPCLACGLTRAFDWTTHGHFLTALKLTPLGALVVLGTLLAGLYAAAVALFRLPVPELEMGEREARWARLATAGAIVMNWVYMVATRPGPHAP